MRYDLGAVDIVLLQLAQEKQPWVDMSPPRVHEEASFRRPERSLALWGMATTSARSYGFIARSLLEHPAYVEVERDR